jgi:phosphatidylglycerol:prolipoprotein diacylglycerol transferase
VSVDPVALSVLGIEIKWYGTFYAIGFLFANYYSLKIIKKYKILSVEQIDRLVVYMVISIIIGGRIGYAVLYDQSLLTFGEIYKVYRGGMSFHGALIGVFCGIVIFSYRSKVNILSTSDLIAASCGVGIFLGRIGNFINKELYGRVTEVPWAYDFGDGIMRHPSQIYEAILEGLVIFMVMHFLVWKSKKILQEGYLTSVFLILYSVFRFFTEFFREPDEQTGFLFMFITIGQLLSIIMLLFGTYINIYWSRKTKPMVSHL